MDELDKNISEDFWRKTFDEAAETPPPRVWDSIERRLNESNGPKILPLWSFGQVSSRSILWGTGIAAALALLLVGWWIIDAPSANKPTARLQSSSQTDRVALNITDPTRSPSHKPSGQSPKGFATVDGPSANASPTFVDPKDHVLARRSAETEELVAQGMARSGQHAYWLRRSQALSRTATSDDPARPMSQRFTTSFTSVGRTMLAERLPGQLEAVTFQELRGKPLRLRSPGPIQRIVWSRPAEPREAALAKGKQRSRELWASVSAMPGAFNPMVSLRSALLPTGLYNSAIALTSSNQPTVSSRANFSVAYQASAGIQLNERWSVESGVGYLAGRSTVEAPVQSAVSNFVQMANTNRAASGSGNAYVNALRSSASTMAYSASPATSSAGATYDLIAGNYINQAQQTLTNDYQYVQVPVQVGYQLRPRKKVSLAVLGGLLTNIFVRNTVGSDLVVKAKDGIYKPVSLAATMGARVRYRPSGRWSASMAGLYQPSLSSSTEADSQVQSRPTSTGMSFGLDYHF